ncbi:MAG: DUF2236 domain-containing protein [Streptosporangiales bacterium]|nr:DUF2236 domain-containing protein [Streptosporangiales bacterium]
MHSEPAYGPWTVTWRVHADPAMLVAGLRALHLQALEPHAMLGVAQNSDYREDPWGRLFRTIDYVATVTYGTRDEAEAIAARVRRIHRALRGHDPYTGTEFRIDDPELLRWVHVAEIESYLTVTRRAGLRLSRAEADQYVKEQLWTAELVGLDPADVPGSVAEIMDYYERLRPRLRAIPEAKEALRFTIRPPMPRVVSLATPARPAWAMTAFLGFALLPRWARRLYGFWSPVTFDAAATAAVRALRRSMLTGVPRPLREGPYIRTARRRLDDRRAPRLTSPDAMRRLLGGRGKDLTHAGGM